MSSSTTRAPEYTEQQAAAIDTRKVSVSLSAGAGCGKTFVLTERYLSHFDPRAPGSLQPEQIGQLVAITFTDRAAREMRDRIRRRCYERLQSCDEADAGFWNSLLRTLDNARINTIHGFCAALLRSRAVEAGLDPQFTVLEQAQAEALLSEAIDGVLRRLIAAEDETALDLAVQFNLDGMRGMIRHLVLDCRPELLERWRDATAEQLLEVWQEVFESLRPQVATQVLDSEFTRTIYSILKQHVPAHQVMAARRETILTVLESLERGGGTSSLAERLHELQENAKVQSGGGARVWPDAEVYGQFRDAAAKLRDLLKPLIKLAKFSAAEAREAAELGTKLLGLAAQIYEVYQQRKQELRVLDFDDLLVRARALLVEGDGRELANQLSESITLLLVDEFQDTDPLQVDLVKALCGDGLSRGKLFFVGDFKQSIYRFRGAKPHVFRDLRKGTPKAGQLSLSKNFRSQPAILNFVNALFATELGPEYEPLVAHRQQVAEEPAIEFLWAPSAAASETVGEMRAREADWIARRLRELIDSGQEIVHVEREGKQVARRLKPGDIAILLRALSDVDAYEAALRKYELDYYLVGGHAFYAQQEVFDLLNLLRAVDDKDDVVSLTGVLRSPFFGLADETIFWLAQEPGGLGAAILGELTPAAVGDAQQRQVRLARETMAHLRACKDRVRVSELIERALDRTGYDATVLREFLGKRKLANLQKLQEQARSFQRGDFLGLNDFIAQLSDFVSRQPDEALAATHSEDTDVVRLMTVHQSKGLEFPLVVVPDMNRKPHSGANATHLHEQLGPLARATVDDDGARPVCGYDLWRFMEQVEEEAESKRLLYVATTRAADYLLLSGGVRNLGEASSPWTQLLARHFDLVTGAFRGRDLPFDQRPKVRVTATSPREFQRRAHARHVEVAQLASYLANAERTGQALPVVEPVPRDLTAGRQFSFSRLSGKLHRKFERLDDAITHLEGPDPRQLGTLVHAVLGAWNLNSVADLDTLVERFAEQHLPDSPGDLAEARHMLTQFAASSRAQQLKSAATAHAEVEFLLPWNLDGAKGIALRGYLDQLYQDNSGAWHILDFKTNRIGRGGVSAVAAQYEMQMYVYGLAAERILKVAPAELTLHFLRTGDEVSFSWDDSARRSVMDMVNEAIRAALTEPATLIHA
jgi:ATP-dependent helicase/nuclease subunit A